MPDECICQAFKKLSLLLKNVGESLPVKRTRFAEVSRKKTRFSNPGKQTYYCSVDDANLSLNFASQVVSKLLSLQRALRVSASGLALLKDKIAELVPALFSSSLNCED